MQREFVVSTDRGLIVIEWNVSVLTGGTECDIEELSPLSRYLYWAYHQDALYSLETPPSSGRWPRKPACELASVKGCFGEYEQRLFVPSCGNPVRYFSSTHLLTQHGLDGLPQRVIELLNRPEMEDEFLFRVEGEGAFDMTYGDWKRYFLSGRNSRNVMDLAVGHEVLR